MTTNNWAAGFQPPSRKQAEAAVGSFPCSHDKTRRKALQSVNALQQQTLSAAELDQVNKPRLFRPKQVQSLTPPRDEADWLACYAEEGQTFDDYVRDLALRSGRFRTHAGMDRYGGIVLVPIVRGETEWPKEAPPLEELARFVQAFFLGTPVTVSSSPAHVKNVPTKKKNQLMEWKPPCEYQHLAPERWVTSRQSHERLQIQAESLLTCLTDLTNGKDGKQSFERPFCVV